MSSLTGDTVRGGVHKRPWLAALLALLHPGLGHVYLREWARALLWFGLALTTTSLLIPQSAVPTAFSVDAIVAASRALPTGAALALGTIVGLSMVDAYWLANRRNKRRDMEQAGARCPSCGREVDGDLSFCHWCTTEFETTPESADPGRDI